ncbi:MAG: dienelactone hydrolase family protein [Anaerolineae bacterium]|nr:dienelactone hydrolase family protein [Anaerolineae bacterium]
MSEASVLIPCRSATVVGDLSMPPDAELLVIFAHGSGSSRHSPRNRAVARVLNEGRMGTLLLDLLTAEEDAVDAFTAQHRFDIPLLAARLLAAIAWAREMPETRRLPIGLFGASTGAAAALVAAAQRPDDVCAIVSRGGRPDLADEVLPHVKAPTLLIVGSRDRTVLDLNRQALERLSCPKRLEVVPGATHLFEEPGALDHVAQSARAWFNTWAQPVHGQRAGRA